MKAALIQAFASLREGETVPFSRFPADCAEEMLSEGGVASIVRGSRKSLKVVSRAAFDVYLLSKGLRPEKLEETIDVLSNAASRAEQVQLVGDSKAVSVRSCPGFPVNIISPLSVRLGEPSDVIVVGVENMENFRLPERQTAVWEQIRDQFGGAQPLLLVSRYPQSRDLVTWLKRISNPYVHFGDFDLAGVHIYLSEFYARLGDRASFFVPEDVEERLATSGSRVRYEIQFPRFGKMDIPDLRVKPLVDMLHHFQKGYDQEGYIIGPSRV